MTQKPINPIETEAQTESSKNEQPRRLGLKIRSRVRAGASLNAETPGPKTPGCTFVEACNIDLASS